MPKSRTPRAWKRPDVAPASSLEERAPAPEIGQNVIVPVGERNSYTGGTIDRISQASRSRGGLEFIRLRMVEKSLARRGILVPEGTSYIAALALLEAAKESRQKARAARVLARASRKVRGPVSGATRRARIESMLTCLFPNCGQPRSAEVHTLGHQFVFREASVQA